MDIYEQFDARSLKCSFNDFAGNRLNDFCDAKKYSSYEN